MTYFYPFKIPTGDQDQNAMAGVEMAGDQPRVELRLVKAKHLQQNLPSLDGGFHVRRLLTLDYGKLTFLLIHVNIDIRF